MAACHHHPLLLFRGEAQEFRVALDGQFKFLCAQELGVVLAGVHAQNDHVQIGGDVGRMPAFLRGEQSGLFQPSAAGLEDLVVAPSHMVPRMGQAPRQNCAWRFRPRQSGEFACGEVHIFPQPRLGRRPCIFSHSQHDKPHLVASPPSGLGMASGPLRMWFLPATGVAVALSALGWWGISWVASDVANRVVDALGVERGEGWIQSLTQGAVSWFAGGQAQTHQTLVLVCMGPILAMVSEAAEVRLTGRELPFSWRRAWKDAWRGLRSALLLAAFEGVCCCSVGWRH